MSTADELASAAGTFAGRTVGNWQLDRLLGEGSFGAVYEARHLTIAGKHAAVKILHPTMAIHADVKRRFVNEASAASRAEHENIIQVYDGGITDEGLCFVVMELLRGSTLSHLIRDGALDLSRTINVGVQIASALEGAHALGIVHRDLKPDNVYVVPRAQNPEFLKVLDFGIAKLCADPETGQSTRAGMWLGTPGYMSPEQWQTLPDIDGRADVYALGVILHECVTGELPYRAATPYAWMTAHLTAPVPELSRYPEAHRPLAALITRMLAKDREARPQTMLEVGGALQLLRPMRRAPSTERTAVRTAERTVASDGEGVLEAPISLALAPTNSAHDTVADLPAAAPAGHRRLLLPLLVAVAVVAAGLVAVSARHAPANAVPSVAASSSTAAAVVAAPPAPSPGLVALPSGRLRMGREPYGKKKALDVPAHDVEVAAYAIGRTEVTRAEFQDFVDGGGAGAGAHRGLVLAASDAALPVSSVSHEDAERYCRFRYPHRGRLPTEAEWEWAARGATGRLYPWGDALQKECVNGMHGAAGSPTSADAHPCGATPEGVADLSGNLWEWTASPPTAYPGSTVKLEASKRMYVIRGGSYYNTAGDELTGTTREFVDEGNPYLGFRCAADL